MPDVMTPEQRSRCMSRVRSTKTKPEMALRRSLFRRGLRFRVAKKLPGRPDIVFTKAKLAIFVDGCFWHCCPIHGALPASNREFWEPKLARNRERDREVTSSLEQAGWTVRRFWEHEVAQNLEGITDEVASLWRAAGSDRIARRAGQA